VRHTTEERIRVASTEIHVKGMSCGGCEGALSSALKRLDGVDDAAADHAAERVTVSFNPALLDEEDLRRAVAKAGYEAVPQ
jgi:copper chaperone CopZ